MELADTPIAEEYKAAYKALYNKDINVYYSGGWYRLGSKKGQARRPSDVARMAENLRKRAPQ